MLWLELYAPNELTITVICSLALPEAIFYWAEPSLADKTFTTLDLLMQMHATCSITQLWLVLDLLVKQPPPYLHLFFRKTNSILLFRFCLVQLLRRSLRRILGHKPNLPRKRREIRLLHSRGRWRMGLLPRDHREHLLCLSHHWRWKMAGIQLGDFPKRQKAKH